MTATMVRTVNLKGGLEGNGDFIPGAEYEQNVIKAKEALDGKRLLLSAAYEARGSNWLEAETQRYRYARYSRPDNVSDDQIAKYDNNRWYMFSKSSLDHLKEDATRRREFAESEMDKANEAIAKFHVEYDDALLNLIDAMGQWYDYVMSKECIGRPVQVVKLKTYHKTFCRWVYGNKELVGSELVL